MLKIWALAVSLLVTNVKKMYLFSKSFNLTTLTLVNDYISEQETKCLAPKKVKFYKSGNTN